MIVDPGYMPEVVQVVAGKGTELFIYFNDGSIHRFDAAELLQGESFAVLRDAARFRGALTVMGGTVAWDLTGERDEAKCLDLDPVTLYKTTSVVTEADWLEPGCNRTSLSQRKDR